MGSRDWVDRRSVVKDPVNRREDAKWHGSSGESQSILNDDEVYDEEGCSKMRHRERERESQLLPRSSSRRRFESKSPEEVTLTYAMFKCEGVFLEWKGDG